MESINIFKGYGKVNPDQLEDQTQTSNPKSPKPQKPLFSILTISALICLTLVIGLLLAALIHVSNSESPSLSSSNSAESAIKTICNVTRYPNSCFTSISSLNTSPKPDPETIFKLSLEISVAELSNISSLLNTMNSDPATRDCVDQLEDALSRLNDSVSAMGQKALTVAKLNDIQTWISSAVTDQETCLDGLEEMGSTAVDKVKSKMKRSMEYTSNSLAIVANFKAILDKFHIPLH
ncbi:PREDICTED: pectinesterase [Prunus dulcis]|uniref:pectinesterase n=1 Tax=Prunus dulcis TaxID=3755 RepID=A0A5E4ENS3_PRUDU|nr:pectinesterase 1 [Prunus dulcis]KAI5329997.1 hypothetical protein L3X38_029394 [Prunus dulcis]VVA17082.1 PREDICTED: pectinesterase [Prunus dulcis]